ncbi:hypothetical protein FDG2_2295 [Candidatus Protofrankia californiensis]|uniref:Uncharacterized protein n=1 Tax=Candidatus Protofrankia californiensis TaxID=1839754 RepID=A0A1C3NXC1_9ACTN|nr:hypothetical protein FDG2_2295 [Candidatus Protofrankia californiensis]
MIFRYASTRLMSGCEVDSSGSASLKGPLVLWCGRVAARRRSDASSGVSWSPNESSHALSSELSLPLVARSTSVARTRWCRSWRPARIVWRCQRLVSSTWGRSSSSRAISAARGGGHPAGQVARAFHNWRIASRASSAFVSASAAPSRRARSAASIRRATWCASQRINVLFVCSAPSSASMRSPSSATGSAGGGDSSLGVDEVDVAARGRVFIASASPNLHLHDKAFSRLCEVVK